MNERLKQVRKHFAKTQKDFGKSLGVSRDTYASYETGRVVPNDTFIQLLCSLYNVNKEWLRTGKGQMLVQSSETILDELARAHNLSKIETAIIGGFLDLSPEGRATVAEYIQNIINRTDAPTAPTREEMIKGDIAATEKKLQEATEKQNVK